MKDLDSAKDTLLNFCSPGGQDALTLKVSQLHDLCSSSEQEVRHQLVTCEAQLKEKDRQLARVSDGLKEAAAALQWELRSLDQALSYSEPQDNMNQLQQHWNSLQVRKTLLHPTFLHILFQKTWTAGREPLTLSWGIFFS